MNIVAPSLPLSTDDQRVDVWRAPLELAAEDVEACRELMSADELERAGQFKFADGCRRFIAARTALRKVLSRYLPRPPAEWRFTYGPRGKPAPALEAGEAPVRFNVSHAHELAVIAVTRGREVGVDVEWLHRKVDYASLARRFFGPRELATFQAAADVGRAAVFFRIWTRKEAWLKAKGEGIAVPPERFDVFEHLREASATGKDAETPEGAVWRFAEFDCAGGYVGAVVVPGPLTALRFHEA